MDVALGLNSGVLGGAIVVAGEKGYIKLGSTGYKLPDSISEVLVAPAREAKNGLTKTGAMFYINPQDWQMNARVIGEESIAGEPTVKLTADILVNVALSDLAKLVDFLTLIHVTQALGLPTEITPKMRAAFLRSVKDVKGVGVGGQGRPRPAQGPRDGEDGRRQGGPQDAARTQERDARRDGEHLRGRRPAGDQRADAARPLCGPAALAEGARRGGRHQGRRGRAVSSTVAAPPEAPSLVVEGVAKSFGYAAPCAT